MEAQPLPLIIVVDLLDIYVKVDNLPGVSLMLQHM